MISTPQDCPVEIKARLKQIEVKHYDFEYKVSNGNMVVFDVVSDSVTKIFEKLFELKFPIHKIQPMEKYNWDDNLSMEDNNSSCFNYRRIECTQNLSIHSYGMAIDINPLQNPFIKDGSIVSPSRSEEFTDRSNYLSGMLEPVVKVFKENGFTIWGGDWTEPKDYHHFQSTRAVAESLLGMNYEDGLYFWSQFTI